ncbi:MAG: hypothetical protein CVV64_05160 [Candidatus Wallbacteria bacterium HGW-Wallbacteria-1]|uniref:SCP domain-containing protein n=1 Tax=Candidatus Wallbacteria bacterium HGW-Wallbacteria-1 TaxID=2013854 RepID=A0A2N1PS40_9BACT|nr:MAG: hypothetical protein CVV64_05160 [Candidatus Wallbacteria bacterium HGW-Wallbacteria-1]
MITQKNSLIAGFLLSFLLFFTINSFQACCAWISEYGKEQAPFEAGQWEGAAMKSLGAELRKRGFSLIGDSRLFEAARSLLPLLMGDNSELLKSAAISEKAVSKALLSGKNSLFNGSGATEEASLIAGGPLSELWGPDRVERSVRSALLSSGVTDYHFGFIILDDSRQSAMDRASETMASFSLLKLKKGSAWSRLRVGLARNDKGQAIIIWTVVLGEICNPLSCETNQLVVRNFSINLSTGFSDPRIIVVLPSGKTMHPEAAPDRREKYWNVKFQFPELAGIYYFGVTAFDGSGHVRVMEFPVFVETPAKIDFMEKVYIGDIDESELWLNLDKAYSTTLEIEKRLGALFESLRTGLTAKGQDSRYLAETFPHSREMAERGYCSDFSPLTGTFNQRMAGLGLEYSHWRTIVSCGPTLSSAFQRILRNPFDRESLFMENATHWACSANRSAGGWWYVSILLVREHPFLKPAQSASVLLGILNRNRVLKGLSQLREEPALSDIAFRTAGSMAESGRIVISDKGNLKRELKELTDRVSRVRLTAYWASEPAAPESEVYLDSSVSLIGIGMVHSLNSLDGPGYYTVLFAGAPSTVEIPEKKTKKSGKSSGSGRR